MPYANEGLEDLLVEPSVLPLQDVPDRTLMERLSFVDDRAETSSALAPFTSHLCVRGGHSSGACASRCGGARFQLTCMSHAHVEDEFVTLKECHAVTFVLSNVS